MSYKILIYLHHILTLSLDNHFIPQKGGGPFRPPECTMESGYEATLSHEVKAGCYVVKCHYHSDLKVKCVWHNTCRI